MPPSRYKAVVERITHDIRSGRFPPGHRLPTHRELAHREGLALGTATRVFNDLRAAGLVTGEVGRGTFVRANTHIGVDTFAHDVDREPLLDLVFNQSSGRTETDLLRSTLKQLSRRGALDGMLLYQPHGGQVEDRRIVARWLNKLNVPATIATSVIVGGAQHGLAATALALVKPGDLVAVDALTYPGFKAIADLIGFELASISGPDGRTSAEALDELCTRRRVRAAYLMPTVHNPLGFVLTEDERNKIVDVARRHELVVIEDGAYAFLEPGAPAPLVARLPDHCVYVTSLSKNLATGLRCGFLHAPKPWASKIEQAIRATIWNVPALLVTMTTQWLSDGTVAATQIQRRRDGKKRQNRFTNAFCNHSYLAHPNGTLVWIPMPEKVRANRVAGELAAQGIAVTTADAFSTTPHAPQAIRIALGSVELERISNIAKVIQTTIEKDRET